MAQNGTNQDDEELYMACRRLDIDQVKRLLKKGADPCALLVKKEAASTLHFVCGHLGRLDILKVLINICREKCNFELQDENGWTPLHHAASCCQQSIIVYLITKLKCDPMIRTNNGQIPLHLTCVKHVYYTDQRSIVKFFVNECGCDVNATDTDGKTPLMFASGCRNGQLVVKCLICDCQCDLSLQDSKGNTALHIACKQKSVETTKLILEAKGCDVNVRNNEGFSPVLLACTEDDHSMQNRILETLELLVEANCDVSAVTNSGETAIMLIVKWVETKYQEIIEYLVNSCGCDLSLQNNNGNTALHIACRVNNATFVDALLKQKACNLGIKNSDGNTPLHVACSQGYSEIAKMIASVSCNELYTLNNSFQSPFQVASSESIFQNPELCRLLVTKMYENNDSFGNTPLHIACKDNDVQLLKVAVELKCDPNLTNITGETPVHLACTSGNLEMVRLLMKMNCDTKIENKDGDDALMIALHFGHLEIVELLIRNTPRATLSKEIRRLLENSLDPCHLVAFHFEHSKTILHALCCERGDTDLLRLIYSKVTPTSYEPRDEKGFTPLHYACYSGNTDIAKYLINELSCDATIKTKQNEKALHLACISHAEEAVIYDLVTFLVTHASCDYNDQTQDGHTPLMLLIKSKLPRNTVAQYLIVQCACDLSLVNFCGQTALHLACSTGNIEVVKCMVEKVGFNPDVKNGFSPLYLACKHAHREIVKLLLKAKEHSMHELLIVAQSFTKSKNIIAFMDVIYDLSTKHDEEGNNALHLVCINGSIQLGRTLTRMQPCLLYEKNMKGNTPLHLACKNSNSELAIHLLNTNGCDVNVKNCEGDSPVDIAFRNGELSFIELLINRSQEIKPYQIIISLNHLVNEGVVISKFLQIEFHKSKNLLHIVCGALGDFDLLKHILASSSDCSQYFMQIDENGQTPIHYACIFGHFDLFRYLVKKKSCDPDIKNARGEMLLHTCCDSVFNEDTAMLFIKFLITTCKSDYNATSMYGYTPLMMLLRKKESMTTVLKYLIITCQCDLSLTNDDGNTALHFAAANGHINAIKMILLQSHFNENTTDSEINEVLEYSSDHLTEVLLSYKKCGLHKLNKESLTPLTLAEKYNHQEIVSLLLQVTEKYQDENGNTLLHIACMSHNLNLVAKILSRMYDLNVTNNNGDTPFHIACRSSNSHIATLLLDSGCNVECLNKNGDSPLHIACRCGNESAVKRILNVSTNTEQKNKMGKTPLQIAFQHKHPNIASILITGHDPEYNKRFSDIVVLEKSFKKVKKLLVKGFDPDPLLQLKFNASKSLLHIACGHAGDLQVVKMLTCSEKCEPNIKDDQEWTPLHYACFFGRLEIVKYLINQLCSDVNIPSILGVLPLQLACNSLCAERVTLDIVKFLITTGKCDPNTKAYNGDTLLIYLLKTMNAKDSLMQYLIVDYGCELLAKSHDGNTALHIACSKKTSNTSVIKMIGSRTNHLCYSVVKNNAEDTPLHLACLSTNDSVVKSLLELFRGHCGLYERNALGYIPLQLAVTEGNKCNDKEMSKLLIKYMFDELDRDGNTPLHTTCVNEDIELLKIIIESNIKTTDISISNDNGDTALHIACRTGNFELVSLFMKFESSNVHVSINAKDKCGDSPLHIACRKRSSKICMLLIHPKVHCDINAKDSSGNTPFHLACQFGLLKLCEELIDRNTDINTKNDVSDSPLILACRYCHFEVIKLLINNPHIQINLVNDAGDTFLHALCQSSSCSSRMVLYVLEVTQFNPNVRNVAGLTPIQLTSNPDIIHELVRFGANPKESEILLSSSIPVDTKHPPQPVSKVFIVGNPSVGKSTLTAALQKESVRFFEAFSSPKKITGVEKKTAGIIPYEFDSGIYGQVTLYDFAGHREFYGSHAALMQTSADVSPPTFLLVVDLREPYDDFKQSILYWLSFIENQYSDSTTERPHIIVVGSHFDVLKSIGESHDDKQRLIEHIQTSSDFTGVVIVGFVAMDCQYSQSGGMSKLRHYLKDSCKIFRTKFKEHIRFNAQCFLSFLLDKYKGSKAIVFNQLMSAIRCDRGRESMSMSDSNPLFCLPDSFQVLLNLCYDLSDRGHILFLRDKHIPSKSWIVIEKESLLTEVTGTIFAPEGLQQYCNLASSTGVMPLSRLSEKFSKYNPTMLVNFLIHLEYCHEISDKELFEMIGEQVRTTDMSENEVFLFFPALVKLKAPQNVWLSRSHITNHCGWVLKCCKQEQFFTTRFLEVLLLRLAFSFALVLTDDSAKSDDSEYVPVLQRKCSIWKNGLFWSNCDGIDSIVEVHPDNKAVTVAMRFSNERNNLLPFLQLRSSIIQKVLVAINDFCPKVKTAEYFADSSEIFSYPFNTTTLFSIKEITHSILNSTGKPKFVVPEVGSSLPLRELLIFEPYALVNPSIIVKSFDSAQEEIPDFVLKRLAEIISKLNHEHATTFTKAFNCNMHMAMPPTSAQMFHILKMWKKTTKGTYECFKQNIDQYSIYRCRNLLYSKYRKILIIISHRFNYSYKLK